MSVSKIEKHVPLTEGTQRNNGQNQKPKEEKPAITVIGQGNKETSSQTGKTTTSNTKKR